MDNKNLHIVILIVTLVALNIIVFYVSPALGIITSLLSIFALVQVYVSGQRLKDAHQEEIETLDRYFDDITRSAVFSIPIPVAILKDNGSLVWYNTLFRNLFDREDLRGTTIEALVPELVISQMMDEEGGREGQVQANVDNKYYEFYYSVIETHDQEDQGVVLLYGFDQTEFEKLKLELEGQRPIVMVIEVDNYDDIRSSTDETVRPILLGQVDRIINSFAAKYQGFIRKYENDKYLLIADKANYLRMKNDRFSLVEELRQVGDEDHLIEVTISAGVGSNKDSPLEVYKTARLALDIAQGRGGDQIVENNGENLQYYGGKKGAVNKRTKVKSRIIANATVQLIDQLQNVYIMGHKNPDMDSFGACLGMYALVKSRGANGKIVLREVNPPISSLYEEAITNVKGLTDDITSPEEAVDMAGENDLIVLLDNHSASTAEAPELLDISDNLILIDHHRRGEEYVESPTLTYLEPYASSTSELVTEIIQYTDDVDLPKTIAEGLLAGIKVDTKSFTFQTGVRTFEAASYLQKEGADAIKVNALFDEPMSTVRSVAAVVAQAQTYSDITALSHYQGDEESPTLVAAKAADQMLNIKGIKASFVLSQMEGLIHISGRSNGDISVQIILERMGGGGHQTAAAVQLRDVEIEEAKQTLKDQIDIYLEEERSND